jgi:hypothetical protein
MFAAQIIAAERENRRDSSNHTLSKQLLLKVKLLQCLEPGFACIYRMARSYVFAVDILTGNAN